MTGRVLFVSDDLMFWSRVASTAKALGRDARRIGDDAAMASAIAEGGLGLVIVDLAARGVDAAAWAPRLKTLDPAPELLAFGSHVDETALAGARAAGFDRVIPNSRFHRELAEILR